MARRSARPAASQRQFLTPLQQTCPTCGQHVRVAYHSTRTLMTLAGLEHFTLAVRQCRTAACARFRQPYRPEAEGSLALPKAEIGLDVIALVGTLRFAQHRSIPEIHRELQQRGILVSQCSVTNLIDCYEELLALAVSDPQRLSPRRHARVNVLRLISRIWCPGVGRLSERTTSME